MIEGHCTTLFLVTSKREAGFRQYPRQELAAYQEARSDRKIKEWIFFVGNDRVERDRWLSIAGYCAVVESLERGSGGSGAGERG